MTKASRSSLLIAVPLLITAFTGCSKSRAAQQRTGEQAAKPVKTEAVRLETVRRPVDIVGTLAAEDEVTVSSQAEGVVRRVLADLGDHVTAGQPLVEIDREKLEYSLDQQKAALNSALTKYGANEPGSLPAPENTPDVRRANADLAQAKQAFDRANELHKRQLISQQQLDDAQTTLNSKQASYDASLQSARNLRAEIDASGASMKLADRQLRDAFVRAPFDGYIQKRMVSTGELVKGQMPVMTVVRVNPLKALGEIPERMAPWVRAGQAISLNVDAFPGRTFNGTVSRISPGVNSQTRTFAFEALVPNGDGALKPGTFARVHLETAMEEKVTTIPYAAMQYRYGVNRAFVVNKGTLRAVELKLGDRREDRMEILDGVKPGELVALTDVDNLTDGMKVAVGGDGEGGEK